MTRPCERRLGAFLFAFCAAAALGMLLAPGAARAYFEDSEVGTRALGFSRAFTALADDPSAIYWNPAGIVGQVGPKFSVAYSKPYSVSGLSSDYLAGEFSVGPRCFGASLYHESVSGASGEDIFTLATGGQVLRYRDVTVDVGVAAKLARVSLSPYTLEGASAETGGGSASGFAADVGVLVRMPSGWSAGWVVRNIGSPTFDILGEPGPKSELPTLSQIGVAYRWNPESTVAVDLQKVTPTQTAINIGAEIWFYKSFAIRAGFSNENAQAGFTIHTMKFDLETAVLTSELLGASYRVGLQIPLAGRPVEGTP